MTLRHIPRHIIAIDLDGTLLRDDKTIDNKTKRFLQRLEKLGHIIVIATGRPYRAIMRYYDDIGLHGPIVCYNGACVTNPNDSQFRSQNFSFPLTVVKDIYDQVGPDHIENVMCETNRKIWLLKEDTDLSSFFWHDSMEIIYGDIRLTLDENPMTMIIKSAVRTPDSDKLLYEAVRRHDRLKIRFWNLSTFSEIYYDFISKGHALHDIADQYGIPKDRIIAFGDAENDLEMLQMAGTGFAMNNAIENLKQHADFVTKYSNNEYGIFHALKKFFREYKN